MIFTARGADKEFEKLIAKLGILEQRLAAWRKEMQDGSQLGIETAETEELFRQLELGRMRMQTDLHKARIGIRMGATQWRTTVPFLKLCQQEIQYLERHLDEFDTVAASARARADSFFGNSE